MRWWRGILVVGILGVVLSGVRSAAHAHANLARSSPPANDVLALPPPEIRLWFTEPLEPAVSHFTLRNRNGDTVDTPASQPDANDPYQLFMQPGPLPDGLYTVVWRVVSSADGHQTNGSFSFIVGDLREGFGAAVGLDDVIPVGSAAIRWVNLLTLALLAGSLGFLLFVWTSSLVPDYTIVENRMAHLIWAGWLFSGMAAVLTLLLQVSIFANVPVLKAIAAPSLDQIVTETRYGHLWLARMGLWLAAGGMLAKAAGDRRFYWPALGLSTAILLVQSLHSHASAALDSVAAVSNDWLHLVAAAFWLGGLVQFLNVIIPLRHATPILAVLVARFSNFARILVATLVLTGTYSAWLQVGSLESLLETQYGQVLLVKLILITPLLSIAAVNLVLTQQRLKTGHAVWGKQLQRLVSAEIALLVGVVAAVGVMTAIAPARSQLAADQTVALPAPQANPITETQNADGLNITLTVAPGWAGENRFTITLADSADRTIEDASLIRLRFENTAENLGESELRPEHSRDGVYTATGANLSMAGEWRIRTNIQRPGYYDTLVDFSLHIGPAPPTPPPLIGQNDTTSSLPLRVPMLLLTGLGTLTIGGWSIGPHRPRLRESLPALILIAISAIFLLTALIAATKVEAKLFEPSANTPVKLVIGNDRILPYLITEAGELLRPTANSDWRSMRLQAKVRDAYSDSNGDVWVASDTGLYRYRRGAWEEVVGLAVNRLISSHGYLFVMGNEGLIRGPEHWRELTLPVTNQPATNLVMLGDHSHILQNGTGLYQTNDLGLSWQALTPPEPIETVWVDDSYTLLTATRSGILTWDHGEWRYIIALPRGNLLPENITSFKGRLYAIVAGQFYRQQSTTWEQVRPSDDSDAYFTSLAIQRRQDVETLWVLNAAAAELWSTTDGVTWTKTPIIIVKSTTN
jgi:copper transport protein